MSDFIQIKEFLKSRLSEVSVIFSTSFVAKVEKKEFDLLDAVTRVVIGQMLSRIAANTIISKVDSLAVSKKLDRISELSFDDFLAAGVSGRKAKCIKLLHNNYCRNSQKYDLWMDLPYENLKVEMEKEWGIGLWTINMLSIFYLGHKDVFPDNDRAIVNAVGKYCCDDIKLFPHIKASPYRSFLSLYLWNAYDEKIPIAS